MRILWTILLLSVASGILAQEFKVDTLHFTNNAEQRINYVILGDGFQEAELDAFLFEAEKFVDYLLSTPPHDRYTNYFNAFAISVPSIESGAAPTPQEPIDNYFGSAFFTAGIERLLSPTRTDRVLNVLADNFPLYDQVVLLVNSTKYGGSGGWVATTSLHPSSAEIGVHEIGHSFAGLSDEYWAGPQYARESPNMTKETSPSRVKWKQWMGEFGIGIYSHSGDSDWKKPHQNCKMQFLNSPFCSVCMEQFIYTIHELGSMFDSYTPLASGAAGNINFGVDPVLSDPPSLGAVWKINGEEFDNPHFNYEMDISLLSGSHVLSVELRDTTYLDRRDMLFETAISWTIDGGVSSTQTKGLVAREEIVLSVPELLSEPNFSIYPNPFRSRVQLVFSESAFTYEIIVRNVNGKKVPVRPDNAGWLDFTGLSDGWYLITIRQGDSQATFKLFKSN